LTLIFTKKNPAKRPGNKDGTGLGMPIPMTRKRERAGLRRATAYSLKAFIASLSMSKDYTEDMSKLCEEKNVKAGE